MSRMSLRLASSIIAILVLFSFQLHAEEGFTPIIDQVPWVPPVDEPTRPEPGCDDLNKAIAQAILEILGNPGNGISIIRGETRFRKDNGEVTKSVKLCLDSDQVGMIRNDLLLGKSLPQIMDHVAQAARGKAKSRSLRQLAETLDHRVSPYAGGMRNSGRASLTALWLLRLQAAHDKHTLQATHQARDAVLAEEAALQRAYATSRPQGPGTAATRTH